MNGENITITLPRNNAVLLSSFLTTTIDKVLESIADKEGEFPITKKLAKELEELQKTINDQLFDD